MTSKQSFIWQDNGETFSCHWERAKPVSNAFATLNLVLRLTDPGQGQSQATEDNVVLAFLADTARRSPHPPESLVKLLIPLHRGFIVRSDFLTVRMIRCPIVQCVQELCFPNQYLEVPGPHVSEFDELSRYAVGAVVLRSDKDCSSAMQQLDEELQNRIPRSYVLSTPLENDHLVIAGHRHPAVMAGYLASAAALGIRVTLVDGEGEFLPVERRSGAVAKCIPIDMTADDGLASRIVDALAATGEKYHGITTFTDTWLIPVAKAAQALGLPTTSLDTVELCLDKHATRQLCPDGFQPLRIKTVADLQSHLSSSQLDYPLIVKPCTAWGSQGVHKASTEEELLAAVAQAQASAKGSDLLIDRYVDGPEVDANFVLQDGEILFFELVDGLPCTAEVDSPGHPGDFLETDEIWPTNHPQRESDMIRSRLHSILLRTGVRTGVFHLEARIENSAMHYTLQDGVLDLRPRAAEPAGDPSAFLLEINQRVPGHGGSWGTALAYGIDYPAIYMLGALNEKQRFRSLSVPFANGAPQWVDSVFINSDQAGVYDGDDVCQDLRKRRPDLMTHVQYSNCYYGNGETITDSPARIALFVVASHESRQKVLEISKEIRQWVEVKVR
ncbi:uncharacterized protein ACLA_073190 [Aspergillus clavatus NRRL 1]|uniref:ATP-grasp domain-containing protein n=1 Tax=Aspergillus clavatus (strain ATCC 1007 / CBS 513.65 / DSM 816 / NCTC 3887 / NRRL 1 / QM 1276 / 107) TaxID=344612 RepID=A1C7B3_ASPCL|nr:uncharacterized protein ACLA_073190 [Aspergillus clavatus NRRL 1]EAW14284.1 conserved hypothetical protein [Aspergillus clavatus NRRL 1]